MHASGPRTHAYTSAQELRFSSICSARRAIPWSQWPRPTPENKAHLDTLQSAITTFLALEAGFANTADWNFRHTVEYKIAHFLSGFDGIFTLNQDLLFERHY
jgi:hypothetical protein